jgi:hypothetical protein
VAYTSSATRGTPRSADFDAHDLKSPNRWIEETRSSKITQPDAGKVYLTTPDKVIPRNLGLLSHAGTAVGY